MAFAPRPRYNWRLRTRSLPLGRFTVLMGILNVTPDSFSDGNRFLAPDSALDRALQMLDEGADIIDLGGESTRPNATPVPPAEEQERILPVIKAILRARPDAIVSVDTYNASTAEAALNAGVEIVNDVSGLIWDPDMAGVLARHKPGAVLMHTRGAPRGWNSLPPLPHADILPMVVAGLAHTVSLARAAGFPHENIVLDPGFGFGKQGDENFTLLAHFADLHQFMLPFLVGLSRKRFLTAHLSDANDATRLEATTAANVAAILSGAHLIRVHDIRAAQAAASVADAVFSRAQPDTHHPHPSGIRKCFTP
jgi:dihydropteroate synthase